VEDARNCSPEKPSGERLLQVPKQERTLGKLDSPEGPLRHVESRETCHHNRIRSAAAVFARFLVPRPTQRKLQT
jgi:hypothetical protein